MVIGEPGKVFDLRRTVYDKENGVCVYCGKKCDPFFFDTIDSNPNIISGKSSNNGPFVAHPECMYKHSFISRFKIQFIVYFIGLTLAIIAAYNIIFVGDFDTGMKLLIIGLVIMTIGKMFTHTQRKREENFVKNLKSRKNASANRFGKEYV